MAARRILLAALLAACAHALPSAGAGAGTRVQTASGPLQGFVERGSRKWLGVPFAEPPVGDMRWRPPSPIKPWGALRDATEFKPDCAQFGPGWPSLGETGLNYTSEDCLTMNIFAPLGAGQPLPPAPSLFFLLTCGQWSKGGLAEDPGM